ncbi:FadR family transcriptional regulator [Alcaligenaceae bacterium]|nr:FadR family transcriptional regulator [Alcaligenaceae bacterium]
MSANNNIEKIEPVRKVTLLMEVVNAIADLMMRGVWRPGDMIPTEKELADRFGVGRSTIREAIKSLAVFGILEARPGEGSFVQQPDSDVLSGAFLWGLLLSERNIDELVDVRILIECECARLAAEKRNQTDLDILSELLEKMKKERNNKELLALDNQFHIEIARISQNALLKNISQTIQRMVGVWFLSAYDRSDTRVDALAEHTAIFSAIREGNAPVAMLAMGRHIEISGARLIEKMRTGS